MYFVPNGGTPSAYDMGQATSIVAGLLVSPIKLIATTTITNNTTAQVTFNNLGSYNNLLITYEARTTEAATTGSVLLTVNGDTTNNYFAQEFSGFGTTPLASSVQTVAFFSLGDIPGTGAMDANMTGWAFAAIPNLGVNQNALGIVSISGVVTDVVPGQQGVEVRSGIYGVNGTNFTSITLAASGFAKYDGATAPCIFSMYGSQ